LNTLVIQSHTSPLPRPWLGQCLETVRAWAEQNGFSYQFQGDSLFDLLAPYPFLDRYSRVIQSDVARLLWMEQCLSVGYERVIWLDADMLVHCPEALTVPSALFSVGREVWIQETAPTRYKAYVKVHNAWLHAAKGSVDLPFYRETALRLLERNTAGVPAQFVGPKLLTALHNIAGFEVNERAGMLSPEVARAYLSSGQSRRALDLFLSRHNQNPAALNLSASCETDAMRAEGFYGALVARLLDTKLEGSQ
jgi:hypothetical protein